MRIIVPFLLFLIFNSCKAQEVTNIDGFPEEIEGCSCYFSKSKEDFDNNKFVYLDQYYSGIAFISLNNELIRIDLENENSSDYKIDIEFDTDTQNGDETWWKTGTIKIKLKDGNILTIPFVGECGC